MNRVWKAQIHSDCERISLKDKPSKQIPQNNHVLHTALPPKNLLENNYIQTQHLHHRLHSHSRSHILPRRRHIRFTRTKPNPNRSIHRKRRTRQIPLFISIPKPKRPIHSRISLHNDPLRHRRRRTPIHLPKHKIRLQTPTSLHVPPHRLSIRNDGLPATGSNILHPNALAQF